MTLDVKALLKNLLKKQMSIQHFTAKTDVFAVGAVPKRIKDKIKEVYLQVRSMKITTVLSFM